MNADPVAAYEITIQEPLDIPAVVYAARDAARTLAAAESMVLLLDHAEEPNVVRGYGEPLSYPADDAKWGADAEDVVRRPDGGLSWYHNETACYMVVDGLPDDAVKRHEAEQTDWTAAVIDELTAIGYEHDDLVTGDAFPDAPAHDMADVYAAVDDGYRQIVGTSADNRGGVRLRRACWYEENPSSPAFDALLARDGFADPDWFHDAITVPDESLLAHFRDRYNLEKVAADNFVDAEHRAAARRLARRGRPNPLTRGSCVLGPLPEDY